MRRHFPGTLFSVSPSIVKLMPSCLLTNERVAWYGTWKYGTFIMVAVAATNVGDIRADFDPDISTNNQDNLEVSEKIYEEPKIFRQVFELNNNIFERINLDVETSLASSTLVLLWSSFMKRHVR